MACTGGWDWAPYTHTFQGGARIMSKGIWKSVYLAVDMPGGASITHVVPSITYRGTYPIKRLVEGKHAGFDVAVRVYLHASRPCHGTLSLAPGWSVGGKAVGAVAASIQVALPAGETNVTLRVPAEAASVRLWWAAGLGQQPLYNLVVAFRPQAQVEDAEVHEVTSSRRVGFRYFALVSCLEQ